MELAGGGHAFDQRVPPFGHELASGGGVAEVRDRVLVAVQVTSSGPHLRNTPAGRALMAEGWKEATVWVRYRDGTWPQDMEDANPYREENA